MVGYLVLENGMIFKGEYFGEVKDVVGEVVFTTGMTGYIETLTDPSYTGQIVVQTFPMIGNYGMITEDYESDKINVRGYIVKELCQVPSNFRNEGSVDTFFMKNHIAGIKGIDTRTLTKIIRENGTMNGVITNNLEQVNLEQVRNNVLVNPVGQVSTEKIYEECMEEVKQTYKVAVMDFGLKTNIKRELMKRGCELTVLPYDVDYEEIIKLNPDGVMLTNGPGNPSDNVKSIETIKKLCETNIPIFGICLGHQLTALANGFATEKMKYGHRGSNHPVKDLSSNLVYITSQNHGYTVVPDSVDKNIAEISFSNVNDGSCEGLTYKNKRIFTVQFHPEACGGPKDSAFLFDKFIENMKEVKNNA